MAHQPGIHDRIFPHHLGEKDHGYSFRTREEMNAQTQELNVQLLLDAIERHIRNMPDAYGESFRHIMHRDLHERLEWVLWQALWQWAKRRHRGKPLHWIASRYWHRQGRRAWQFAADTGERTPAGKPVWLRLVNPTETKSGGTSRSGRMQIRSTRTGTTILKTVRSSESLAFIVRRRD